MYQLESFGKELEQRIRRSGWNYKTLSERCDIDPVTLRRIRMGKVTPTLETLELLSSLLKTDLPALFLKYRFEVSETIQRIQWIIEDKMRNNDFRTVSEDVNKIRSVLSTISNSYYRRRIEQFCLMIEGTLYLEEYKDIDRACKIYVKALRQTSPNFCMKNAPKMYFSEEETRVLMNLAIALGDKKNLNAKKLLLEICLNNLSEEQPLYIKVCHNLATLYYSLSNFEQSLSYAERGIRISKNTRNYSILEALFFAKAVAELILDLPEAKESMAHTLSLCRAFGLEEGLKDYEHRFQVIMEYCNRRNKKSSEE